MSRFRLLYVLLCLIPGFRAGAQELLDRTAFTVGATHRDTANQNWAYIAWQSNDPGALASSVFALYGKTGNADSAASYTRKAVVRRQTDPQAINALLDRSTRLGFTLPELNEAVNTLFRDSLAPGNTFTLGQKLSTIFRTVPASKFQTLLAVGRLHPGFNMALGLGAADPIAAGATMTYEVREYDAAADRDLGVFGRVTVTAGVNTPLPAPGRAWEVRDHPENDDSTFTSRTSLVIPLRWATPDALRTSGLGHYGFNVWRMTQAYAESNGYDAVSPTAAQLQALSMLAGTAVRRVNKAAVLSDKVFSEFTVDPARRDPVTLKFIDDRTILFSDDNNRQLGGTNAFSDGEAFYYFITPRDILGHDGAVSPPALARACEIIPPRAPDDVKVEVDYAFDAPTDTSTQQLKVSWKSAPNDGRQKTVRYHVYRWSGADELARQGRKPDSTYRIAVIDHVPGQARHEFLDNPPSPNGMVNDLGEPIDGGDDDGDPATDSGQRNFTWFYTVRAEDNFTCHNFSPHCIAAFGTLRDREGPEAPEGQVLTRCFKPRVQFVNRTDEVMPVEAENLGGDFYHFVFECRRSDERIAWAEFAFFPSDALEACVTMEPIRVLFPAEERIAPGGAVIQYAEAMVAVPQNYLGNPVLGPQMGACRVGSIDGMETPWVRTNIPQSALPEDDHRLRILFNADMTDQGYQPDCPILITRPPGGEAVLGTTAVFAITQGTREWRLYRQCDSGPLTLIKSGLAIYDPVNAAANQIQYEDKDLPFGVSTVCYSVEVSDRHGNSSTLTRLLPCIQANRPPAPVLAPIIGAGTAAEPAMVVRFFCPPSGIDHFEILMNEAPPLPALKIVKLGLTPMPAAMTGPAISPFSILSSFGGSVMEKIVVSQLVVTGPVGTGDGSIGNGPLFSVTVPKLNLRIKQKIVVRAVTKNGIYSERSNGQTFVWSLPSPPPAPGEDPCLPWPARNLPEVVDRTAVEARIEAVRCTQGMMPQGGGPAAAAALTKRFPLAIRVGAFTDNDEIPAGHYPEGTFDPQDPTPMERLVSGNGGGHRSFTAAVFTVPEATGATKRVPLLPIVVYRTQTASPAFPAVSGDLVQVTPLIDRIAERRTGIPGDYQYTLKDPYFLTGLTPPGENNAHNLLLLDTQPVLRGATYQYFIVKFRADGEIDRVIRTNTVTVTP